MQQCKSKELLINANTQYIVQAYFQKNWIQYEVGFGEKEKGGFLVGVEQHQVSGTFAGTRQLLPDHQHGNVRYQHQSIRHQAKKVRYQQQSIRDQRQMDRYQHHSK